MSGTVTPSPDDTQRVTLYGPCPNCEDPTTSPYCPRCGQRRVERRVSLRRMLGEAIEDQLSVNAALPRTVRVLLLEPGRLSLDYLAGRIQRYIPPFRLYLVSSVIFFLLLSFVTQRGVATIDIGEVADSAAVAPSPPNAPATAASTPDAAAPAAQDSRAPADSVGKRYRWGQNMRVTTGIAPLDRVVARRLDELRMMEQREAVEHVSSEALRRAPTAMFLLLPFFAAVLKLLYIRRRRYYVDHFVFGLHTHAFAFLLFSVMLVARSGWVSRVALVWMLVYFYLAMKKFYGQGWFKTLVKYGIMANAYFMLLSFGILGVFITALLLA